MQSLVSSAYIMLLRCVNVKHAGHVATTAFNTISTGITHEADAHDITIRGFLSLT